MIRSILSWLVDICALQTHRTKRTKRRRRSNVSLNGPELFEPRLLFAGINDGALSPETAIYGPLQAGVQARPAAAVATRMATSMAAAMMTMSFMPQAEAEGPGAQVGDLTWISDVIPVTDPRGFATNGTTTLVVGNNGGVGFVFDVTPSGDGAAIGDGEELQDQVAAGSSDAVASRSAAQGIGIVDGKLIPFGAAYGVVELSKATYWTAPNSPVDGSRIANTGSILAISPQGVMVGAIGGLTAAGVVETTSPMVPMIPVPGFSVTGGLTAVTGDSKLLAGSILLWRAADGSMTAVDTTSWEIPPQVLELPDVFFEAVVYGGNHYVAADCITLSFESVVCVWNVETGRLVAMTKVGDQLADFQEVDGQVALTVNGADGAAVYLNLDFETRTELSDRLGTKVIAANRTGLNAGGLGMVVQIDGSYRAVVFELLTEPEEPVIAVHTAVHQGLFPANVLSTNRAIFEVAIRGTAEFDVRTIDRKSLFIGDARSEMSARILSIRYTDVNRDGKRDAIITVDSRRGGVLSDTTSLKITGQTIDGDKFDGTRKVTMTQKTFLGAWIEQYGRDWIRPLLSYLRREFRFWW